MKPFFAIQTKIFRIIYGPILHERRERDKIMQEKDPKNLCKDHIYFTIHLIYIFKIAKSGTARI